MLSLALPPLRERKADIAALAQQFVARFASELQRPKPRFTRNMAEYLTAYRWPGNVRQLRNCLYRAATLLEGDELGPEHVDLPVAADAMPLIDEWFEGGLDEAVKRFESRLLERLYPAFPPPASWPSGSASPYRHRQQAARVRDWQEVAAELPVAC